MKKRIAIIQARMNSSRMPGKILKEISGKPALWHLIENIRPSKQLTDIIVATTMNTADDVIADFTKENAVTCFRGSEENVLERFYEAAKSIGVKDSDIIVRITADDIFMDPYIIDALVTFFDSTYPYYRLVSNSFKPGFPYGLYFELFDFASLKDAYRNATTESQKEHVTPYIREHEETFPAIAIESKGVDLSDVYLSIDTVEDLERNRRIIERLESQNKKHPYLFTDVVTAYKDLKLSRASV
ncbi:MAG: acylneuraminate cytidylyltransferase [Parcubacteria group bacterium Gr01-1014_8]|nr:MAG: acylneuraminate cytidylyltransferase [Parcubacteria group bacterium Gr01-1014_8]